MSPWTFITNHAAVLAHLARHPAITAVEVAIAVGITERAVRRLIADLEASGYLNKERQGRRNIYRVNPHLSLRHLALWHIPVDKLLATLDTCPGQRSRRSNTRTKPASSG